MKKIGNLYLVVLALYFIMLSPALVIGDTFIMKHMLSLYHDDKGIGLVQPEGAAFKYYNNKLWMLVADTGNARLLRYSLEDGKVSNETEIKIPQMVYPTRVQVDSKGEMLVLDGKVRRILRVGVGGEFLGFLELEVLFPLRNIVPRSVKIDSKDNIYILDIFSESVFVLDPQRKILRQIGFPSGYGFISDLAVDSGGGIYLIDSVNSILFRENKEKKKFNIISEGLEKFTKFPANITIDPKDRIYISDQNNGDIVILGKDGSFLGRKLSLGWREGLLYYPSQICISDNFEVIVADRENNRIQIFSAMR